MNHYEGDNFGSIAKFEVHTHYNLSGFNPVSFPPGDSGWVNFPFREQTGQIKVSTEQSPNGPLYTYESSIFIPHMRSEVDQEVTPYLGPVSIVRITDLNGQVYIVGSPGAPVTLTLSGSTGQTYTSENGTEISFKHQQIHPALIA